MLKQVDEFLKTIKIEKVEKSSELGTFYPHDIDIPSVKLSNFEDGLRQLKILENLSQRIGTAPYVRVIKSMLMEHEKGKTFNDIYPLGKYIRRGQYIELVWLATCISLADIKQLELISTVRFLGLPGIYEF